MAHPNFEQRRSHVYALLDSGATITKTMRKSLAEQFDCSVCAISTDEDAHHCERTGAPRYYAKSAPVRVISSANRRARLAGVPGVLQLSDWLAALERHDHQCVGCERSGIPLHLDPIV